MSVMGFQKKCFEGMSGYEELYPVLFWISHLFALEFVTVVESTTHFKLPQLWHWRTALQTDLPITTQDKTRQDASVMFNISMCYLRQHRIVMPSGEA